MRLHDYIARVVLSAVFFTVAPSSAHPSKKLFSVWSIGARGMTVAEQVSNFERQLAPFFNAKSHHDIPLPFSSPGPKPTQADFFKIAQQWNSLSAEFKKTYLRASIIPTAMTMYQSPRGIFEIYYATSGDDSVESADVYGYGAGTWREATGPNGVPDYIDEVAWAFDSAWSMEIDQFQFVQPNPFIDKAHPSGRFKVIVRDVDVLYGSGTYGMTTPAGPAADGAMGQQCYIELRNQWNDPMWQTADTSLHTNYRGHPQWGIRVTGVHEFFHAIQFAMTRSYTGQNDAYLDDFPVTWLEGSAVLMEQAGFADIKDYLQYADSYFSDPTLDLFTGYDDVYSSSLLLLYAYQHPSGAVRIEFTKDMFFNDYRSFIGFGDNLLLSGRQSGGSWADLLGNFHTASFFSGTRSSAASPFLADAPLLPQWSYSGDSFEPGYSVKKNVSAFGMRTFSYARPNSGADTLFIEFTGDPININADTAPLWSVHCILQGTAGDDSIFNVPVSASGKGNGMVTNWARYSGALLVVSNAHGEDHSAALRIESNPIMAEGDISAFPNPLHLKRDIVFTVQGNALVQLCMYTMQGTLVFRTETAPNNQLQWPIKTRGGVVAPGMYYAVIGYHDSLTKGLKRIKRKVVIVP